MKADDLGFFSEPAKHMIMSWVSYALDNHITIEHKVEMPAKLE